MANQQKNTKSKKKNEREVGPRRPLLRSRSDRKIWGVAGGLAAHIGFDPILVRLAFVITSFFGGAGLLAYLAALLLIPAEDSPDAEAGTAAGRNRWLVLGGVIVVLLATWPFFLGGGLA
ncbi:MAG TPA: PspC domain-containing protein, partial [Solirubrobacterales bacterium]|nr:PspC domain-containing protein [Solirubrobacterales bacterium]